MNRATQLELVNREQAFMRLSGRLESDDRDAAAGRLATSHSVPTKTPDRRFDWGFLFPTASTRRRADTAKARVEGADAGLRPPWTGAEKIITKNGESYMDLIDADGRDCCHRLECERIHLLLIDDARRGLEDIAAGRTRDADAAIARLQKRRARPGDEAGKGRVKAAPAARERG